MLALRYEWGPLLAGFAAVLLAVLIAAPVALAQAPRTMSTGVGQEERVANPDYSVRFEFAEVTGPYLANVDVTVYDAERNQVLSTVSEGPWLFADLVPGQYRVVATSKDGRKQGASFSVDGGGQEVIRLAWR